MEYIKPLKTVGQCFAEVLKIILVTMCIVVLWILVLGLFIDAKNLFGYSEEGKVVTIQDSIGSIQLFDISCRTRGLVVRQGVMNWRIYDYASCPVSSREYVDILTRDLGVTEVEDMGLRLPKFLKNVTVIGKKGVLFK